jgi:hypothetical protein
MKSAAPLIAFAALAVVTIPPAPSSRAADEPAAGDNAQPWIELSTDPTDSCWREGRHRGWSAVGDVHLDPDSSRRLTGDSGGEALLSRGDSDLYTRDEFQDALVKLEFMVPRDSNSGVKLNGHYEIQIRDTHGKAADELTGDDCGGVYPRGENRPRYHQIDKGVAPRVNAAKPAGEWQTLEITFRAARFDADGKKIENARFVRVVLNGETIHENVELKHPTGAAWDEQTEIPRGPLQLQGDHGPVAFRHLAIRPLAAN